MDAIVYTFQNPNIPAPIVMAPTNAIDIHHIEQMAAIQKKTEAWLFDDRTDCWVHYIILDGKLRKVAGVS